MYIVYKFFPNHLKVDFADTNAFHPHTPQPASAKNQDNLLYDHCATNTHKKIDNNSSI